MLNIHLNRIALILKIPLSFLYPILFYPLPPPLLPPPHHQQLVVHFLATSLPDSIALRFVHPLVCWLSPHPPKITTYSKILFTRRSIAGYGLLLLVSLFSGSCPFRLHFSYDETLTERESSNSLE